jgi:uncharacterized alkaline shock family protein YloU
MSTELAAGPPGSTTGAHGTPGPTDGAAGTWPDGAAPPADDRLGEITITERVIEKLASYAAWEVPDAGAAAPRVLGQRLPGARYLGMRDSRLDRAPKASVRVDGRTAFVTLSISVRWPASVPHVADDVRERVRGRLGALTGLHVGAVRIEVTDLVTGARDNRGRVR